MTDRVCVRGCTLLGVHYAACERNGPSYEGDDPCDGCAPRECRDGSLICDRCFGRMRGLLDDIFDLIGRMRSLADPSKATPTDEERFASNYRGSKAPIGVDLLDALHAVEGVAGVWEAWDRDLSKVQNDLHAVEFFGARVLDRHPEVDGLREAWSVADAMAQWGPERRTKGPNRWEDTPDDDEVVVGVRREWGDPLISRDEAAEVAGSLRTLQRWRHKKLIYRQAKIVVAGVWTELYRRSDVERVRDEQQARVGRPRKGAAGMEGS